MTPSSRKSGHLKSPTTFSFRTVSGRESQSNRLPNTWAFFGRCRSGSNRKASGRMWIWSPWHAVRISRLMMPLILTSHCVPVSPSPRPMNRSGRQRLPRALRCLPKIQPPRGHRLAAFPGRRIGVNRDRRLPCDTGILRQRSDLAEGPLPQNAPSISMVDVRVQGAPVAARL